MSDGGKNDGARRPRGAPDDGITRRDFLDGVAITAAGLAAAAASPYLTGAEAALAAVGGTKPPSSYTLPPHYLRPRPESPASPTTSCATRWSSTRLRAARRTCRRVQARPRLRSQLQGR